jgi:serine/threonine protein kinase
MELVEGGALCHKIQTTRMNEDEIRFYLAEIICVLQYLHSNKIVYRFDFFDEFLYFSLNYVEI